MSHTKSTTAKLLLGFLLVAGVALVLPWSNYVRAQDTGQADSADALLEYELNTVEIAERFGPSVVAVDVTIAGQTISGGETPPFDQLPDFFREFIPQFQFGEREIPSRETAGSGFVIDAEGHLLTNYHVVAGALDADSVTISEGSAITVSFPGGRALPVEVVGASSIYDLALLRLLNQEDLPDVEPIELADTEGLRPGQKAIAIGNPFGFESTVTLGIVSAVGRHFPYIGEVDFPLVQTDAPINPGNSGGPLLDSSGRLIGVNTAIIPSVSRSGERGNLGIGFAVPADIIASTLPDLQDGGIQTIPTRPRLGVTIMDVTSFPDAVREQLGLPDSGVGILEVEDGGAAEEAGLREPGFSITMPGIAEPVPVPSDIIIEADGEPVNSAAQLQTHIVSLSDGDVVSLVILRGGERVEVDVTLRVVPEAEE